MAGGVTFIRKNGRVIPIHAEGTGAPPSAKKPKQPQAAKSDKKFDVAGIGLSIASGAVGAIGANYGLKGLIAGEVASQTLNVASIAANIASVKNGPGTNRQKTALITKQEVRNQAIGWGTYAVGLAASKPGRAALSKGASKGAAYAGKALELARKALRLV